MDQPLLYISNVVNDWILNLIIKLYILLLKGKNTRVHELRLLLELDRSTKIKTKQI